MGKQAEAVRNCATQWPTYLFHLKGNPPSLIERFVFGVEGGDRDVDDSHFSYGRPQTVAQRRLGHGFVKSIPFGLAQV